MSNRISLAIFFSLFIVFSAFAPSETSKWQEYKNIDGVTIFSKTDFCSTEYNAAKNEYIVFKYVNNNTYDIRIAWKLNLWYDEKCRSCDLPSPNEYELSLDIKAGQTLEYSCTDDSKAFKIFKSSEQSNLHPKIRFELAGLKVTKL